MQHDDLDLDAEEECFLAVLSAAAQAPAPRGHRDRTESCPGIDRLLGGAESGGFDEPELWHLSENCRYCELTLRLAFAEICPPATVPDQARSGALRDALEAHRLTCEPCTARPTVGDAVRRWRAGDPTRRLGTWLVLAGVAVVVVALQSRSLGLPWANPHVGLGLATCVVGYYMCGPNHLVADHSDPRRTAIARLHRSVFALVLLILAVLAGATAWQFRPHGSDELATALARLGMTGGAVLAGAACLVGCAGVALRRPPTSHRVQGKPGQVSPTGDAPNPRSTLTQGSIRACGAACIVYAATHVVIAVAIPTTQQMRVVLIAGAVLLGAAAVESFHPPLAYHRIVIVWMQWGIIMVPSDGPIEDPQPESEEDRSREAVVGSVARPPAGEAEDQEGKTAS